MMAQKQPEGKIKSKCRTDHAKPNGLLFWNIDGKSIGGVPDTLASKVSGGVIFIEFKVLHFPCNNWKTVFSVWNKVDIGKPTSSLIIAAFTLISCSCSAPEKIFTKWHNR